MLRPDVLLPVNGSTVAILREEALIVVAPTANKITDLAGLANKRLGVVSHHDADLPAIDSVLRHYDLASPHLMLVSLERGAVAEAFASKRIDALALMAAPVARETAEIMSAVLAASNGKVTVVPVDESEALALKTPALSTATIPVGSLGGRPKLPEEEVQDGRCILSADGPHGGGPGRDLEGGAIPFPDAVADRARRPLGKSDEGARH